MKNKKIILISILISILIISAWWFFFINKTTLPDIPNTINSFFPFSSTKNLDSTDNEINTNNNQQVKENVDQARVLFNKPISDFTTKTVASSSLVFFIDKDLGNLYLWSDENNISRLSNETILNSREIKTVIENDSVNIYIKYLNDSGNYQYKQFTTSLNTILTEKDLNLQSKDLSINIEEIKDNDENLLVVTKNINGLTLEVAESDLNNKIKAINLPTKSWIFTLTKNNNIVLNTRPSYLKEGFSFILRNKTSALDYLVVNKKGLNILISPNEKNILYSTSDNNKISTYFVDLENNQTIKLPFDTLIDKCTWSSDSSSVYCGLSINYPFSNYPDDWYKGFINLRDNIIGFNITKPQTFYTIFDLQKENIDIEKIELSKNKKQLFYLDKNTANLWISELSF